MTDITELAQREKFEAWVMTQICISKSTMEGLRTADGYRNTTLSGTNYNRMWNCWKAAGAELVEALEKAQQRITQMESRTVTDWIEHDGKWRPESLGLDELVYLKTRKQELKIPYPAGKVKGWMNSGGDMDVMAYKLASPQASTVTVKLPDEVDVLLNHLEDVLPFEVFQLIDAHKWNAVSRLSASGIKVEAE